MLYLYSYIVQLYTSKELKSKKKKEKKWKKMKKKKKIKLNEKDYLLKTIHKHF